MGETGLVETELRHAMRADRLCHPAERSGAERELHFHVLGVLGVDTWGYILGIQQNRTWNALRAEAVYVATSSVCTGCGKLLSRLLYDIIEWLWLRMWYTRSEMCSCRGITKASMFLVMLMNRAATTVYLEPRPAQTKASWSLMDSTL